MPSNFLVRADQLDRRIATLSEGQDRWKADSETAERCFEIEELAHDCLETYQGLCRLDTHWHLESLSDPDATDGSFRERLHELFQHWRDSAFDLMRCIEELRSEYIARGFDPEILDQVGQAFRECEASLNPLDVDTELADEAIAQHRAGLTEDF